MHGGHCRLQTHDILIAVTLRIAVQILLLAAAVSFGISYFEEVPAGEHRGIGHFIEPLVIILILILNATVGVIMARNESTAPLPLRLEGL